MQRLAAIGFILERFECSVDVFRVSWRRFKSASLGLSFSVSFTIALPADHYCAVWHIICFDFGSQIGMVIGYEGMLQRLDDGAHVWLVPCYVNTVHF